MIYIYKCISAPCAPHKLLWVSTAKCHNSFNSFPQERGKLKTPENLGTTILMLKSQDIQPAMKLTKDLAPTPLISHRPLAYVLGFNFQVGICVLGQKNFALYLEGFLRGLTPTIVLALECLLPLAIL